MGRTDSFCPREVSKINKEKNLKFIITSIPFSTQGKQLHLSLLQKKKKVFSFFSHSVSAFTRFKNRKYYLDVEQVSIISLSLISVHHQLLIVTTQTHTWQCQEQPHLQKKWGKKWPKGNRKNKLCPAWVLMRTFWTRQFNTPLVASLERIYSTSGIHSFPFSLVSRKKENKETMSNNNNYNSNNINNN